MHTIKFTSNLLFENQCTSGKFIRLPNRIESKLFLPELECSTSLQSERNLRGPHTRARPQQQTAAVDRWDRQTDRQTDGRTDTRPFYETEAKLFFLSFS